MRRDALAQQPCKQFAGAVGGIGGEPIRLEIKPSFGAKNGATAIEYGLIAAGIALAIITVVNGLGTSLNDKFGSISLAEIRE
jgi:pilus assembly protein Flp/PilA